MVKKNGQLAGLATKQDVDSAVEELAQITDKNFRRVDKSFDNLDKRLSRVEQVLETVVGTLNTVVTTLNTLVKTVQEIALDVKELKAQNLGERMGKIEDEVLELKTRVR